MQYYFIIKRLLINFVLIIVVFVSSLLLNPYLHIFESKVKETIVVMIILAIILEAMRYAANELIKFKNELPRIIGGFFKIFYIIFGAGAILISLGIIVNNV